MKKIFPIFVIVLSVVLSACASQKATPAPSELVAGNPPAEIVSSTQIAEQLVPEVSTTLPDNILPPVTDSANPPDGQTSSTITLDDNGKTFNFHVGDAFLLNLGTDRYDWTVTIDNQNVIGLRMGVTVIEGAQGLFDALGVGTATLSASGDPLCRKSSPPCMMPTILFKVTLNVE
jgi:hypothetical protein